MHGNSNIKLKHKIKLINIFYNFSVGTEVSTVMRFAIRLVRLPNINHSPQSIDKTRAHGLQA